VQTGAGHDPLPFRPGLAAALKGARRMRTPVIVSPETYISSRVSWRTRCTFASPFRS
jgi:hypothetical protein